MVLVSVQSVESNNGYTFNNQFAESLIIDPNSRISLINIQFERRVDYVVLNGGNAFEIKVGGAGSTKDIIGIGAGTYTQTTLAQALQTSLNTHYHPTGYTFSVEYNSKDKGFEITNSFTPLVLDQTKNTSWNVNDLTKVEDEAIKVADSGTHLGNLYLGVNTAFHGQGPWTGITANTSNYVIGDSKLETEYVPTLINGGSWGEFTLNYTGAVYPPVPTLAVATHGIVFAFAENFTDTNPLVGVKEVSSNANLDWVSMGIVIYVGQDEVGKLKIIEGGQDIGVDIDWIPLNGDIYKMTLSSDNNYPVYSYKRVGGGWTKFNLMGATQRFQQIYWENLELHPTVSADVADSTTGPFVTHYLTVEGSSNITPTPLVGEGANYTYTENSGAGKSNTLSRTVAGTDADGYNVDGFLSQLLVADSYSDFEFSMPHTGGDFYVSVIEEEKRIDVLTANGGGNGVVDAGWGNTAEADGTIEPDATFNASLFTYRFNGWNGADATASTTYPTSKIYRRRDMNAYNLKGTGKALAPYLDVGGTFDWTASPNALFMVRIEGSANKVQLRVSPKGDKSDTILLDEHSIPLREFDGVKALGTIDDGSDFGGVDFAPNQSQAFFELEGGGATFFADTDAQGKISGGLLLGNAGKLYDENSTQYLIQQIDLITGIKVGTGEARATISALTDYTHINDMGSAFKSSKINNGTRFFMGFGNTEVVNATETISQVDNVKLLTSQALDTNDYFEFYPQYEPDFGNMIGYGKTKYVVPSGSSTKSDTDPIPNQQIATNPTLIVNVDNLPHKSYIGKGFKADAVLGSKPVGSTQGLTKMIAKVPRHHDDSSGSKANTGPFYFDYFPYSIPLRNATEITLNELDITIRNPDGTLATDIIETHMLLNISGVEGAGEGAFGGSIGKPIEAPRSYDTLNMTNGQLTPTLRGGFAQPTKPLNDQPSRHDRADKHNDLEPMSHL